MTQAQSKLVISWVIGGITILIANYLEETQLSLTWMIPMFIGMPIVRYLRADIKGDSDSFSYNDNNNLFYYMSKRMKLYTALYLFFFAGFLTYFLIVKPNLVGDNVGIFIILALLPIIIVYIKNDLKLFVNAGDKNS